MIHELDHMKVSQDLAEKETRSRSIGKSVLRLEDPPLLRGEGRFVADISFPDQLYMRVVRSGFPHGNIRGIDTSSARALPGIFAVWTYADISDIPPIGFREGRVEELEAYRQFSLATDRVRYVGEPIAVVFAENAYVAEDAAETITLDVDELPVITDCSLDLGEFDRTHSTEPTIIRKGYGDVDAALDFSHEVIELDLKIGRHSGVPLETRGAIARYVEATDILEMYGAAKVPHRTRDQIAQLLGLKRTSVHLFEGHVGGGFGIRGELYPEDLLVCLAAIRFRRPIKWIEDRREHLLAANHSREQRHKIRAGVNSSGRILAIDDRFFHDQGAYVRTHAARVADLTAGMLPGPYVVPAYRVNGHFRLSNKTPGATYRSPGRYESTFVRERMMDAIAARLGIDRVAVRRENLIASADMPYARSITSLGEEIIYDSGNYELLLDKALERVNWTALQIELAARRKNGEKVGAGISMFVEKSGLGPKDGVKISVSQEGRIELITGGASLGQGFETVMAQICAEVLDIEHTCIRVIHGQTDRIEHGVGAHASRATVITGSATLVAAKNLRDKAISIAAELLRIPVADLEMVNGCIGRRGESLGHRLDLASIVKHLSKISATPNASAVLEVEGWYQTEHMNYPYGVHIAVVCVDGETGGVVIERYLVAYDVGRAINPKLVEAQIVGGVSQGLGGALLEEFRYDQRGEPLSTTFADYLMPSAHEMPFVDVLITEDSPSPLNALGLKGAGEGGVTGVAAALAGAIDEAIGIPGAVTEIPVSPQRLRDILRRHG